jgi:hypothetical protein
MSEDTLIAYTQDLLDANGLSDWSVKVNDAVVSDYSGEQIGGACSWFTKEVRFNRGLLPLWTDWQKIDLAQHEVAHALTPEDLNHGDQFKAKHAELRNATQRTNVNGATEDN